MVSAVISWNSKTDFHSFDTNKIKVNSEGYMNLFDDYLIPDCRRLHHFIFPQDEAPSHTRTCGTNKPNTSLLRMTGLP